MIRKTGFAGYFLIVADFIRYAKEIGIPVGPGRGSAAGSLVVYCLGITDLDPMPYHLLFERFLNPERISMPDMDIDFCMDRRDEVIHYVQAKYGNVAQIITFGKMKAKAVVRDVGRVLNMPYGEVDRIAKMIPNALNITLDEALRQEPRLRELAEKESRVKEMMSIAHSLEGLNRHASTHAAGVVISDRPLVEFLPLAVGQKGETVTQYDMKAVEEVGLVKFDFLGLKTLTVIHHALKIIRRTRGEEIAISEIPLDDPEVYQYLSHGNTAGIFQLESSGMRELIVKLKPTAFPDLIALVALYRPGPLGSGMVDDFINRKHGRVQARYELPALESILRETHGVIVYQEQVMQIASAIANFSLGDADILRRAMGKKKPAEMAEQKDKFLKGCLANKIAEKKADKIFDLMAKFAEYGFNKSHSAAYAFISYQTAYLKTHFPVEFMASLLTHEMGNTDKVMAYISHCREIGISILPPDINQSFTDFSVVGESQIRFGLAAVKNVGVVAIESILEVREEKEGFASLIDFCESVDLRKVNRRVIEGLICCGAFDSLGVRRAQAMAGLTELIEHGSRVQRERNSNQAPLFAGSSPGARSFSLPESAEWGMRERLLHEKESLGFYITGHPLDEYRLELAESRAQTLHSLPELADGSTVLVVGVVSALREIVTRNGDRMGFVTLEDLSGTVQVVVFSDLYNNCLTLLKGQDPILVRGQTDQGEEGVKVIAREIAALRRAEGSSSGASPSGASPIGASPLRELHLHLETGQVSRPQLERLKEILAGHHGSSPVSLHFRELNKKETVLALPEDLMVDPSHELIQKLDQLFGGPVALVRS